MLDFIDAFINFSFLKNAFIAGFLISFVCGIIGSFVVSKRITHLSGGISHAIIGGVGLAYFLGIHHFFGLFIFGIIISALLTIIKTKLKQSEDIAIMALWSIGMSIGIILINFTPGYNADFLSVLFGNIMLVGQSDLIIIFFIDIIIIFFVFLFYKKLIFFCFDEEYCKLRGLNISLFYFFILILISLAVISMMKAVGLILTIALLSIPSGIAQSLASDFFKLIVYSVLISIIFIFLGIFFSFLFNLPTGATIIILLGFFYLIFTVFKR